MYAFIKLLSSSIVEYAFDVVIFSIFFLNIFTVFFVSMLCFCTSFCGHIFFNTFCTFFYTLPLSLVKSGTSRRILNIFDLGIVRILANLFNSHFSMYGCKL